MTPAEIERIIEAVKAAPNPEYCLLWIDWWPLCMQKSEWASWVQAIVGICAIVAAFLVVRHQFGIQERLKLRDEFQEEQDLATMLFTAAGTIAAFQDMFVQEVPPEILAGALMPRPNLAHLEATRDRMAKIIDGAKRPYEVAFQAQRLVTATELFIESWRKLEDPEVGLAGWGPNFALARHHAGIVKAQIEFLLAFIEQTRKRKPPVA